MQFTHVVCELESSLSAYIRIYRKYASYTPNMSPAVVTSPPRAKQGWGADEPGSGAACWYRGGRRKRRRNNGGHGGGGRRCRH